MSDNSELIDVTSLPGPRVQINDTHEVTMARAQTYRAAKCAMEIHKMLANINELEGWMQAKLTLAADYLEAVASNLEYDLISATMGSEALSLNIMESATKKVDPKMVHALRSLSKQFNHAFSKADLKDKKKSEHIDVVANVISDITDRITHHKTLFSDPAATRLGKIERELFDHFEPVLEKVIKKESEPDELKMAIQHSVKKFGAKLMDARKDKSSDSDDAAKKKS